MLGSAVYSLLQECSDEAAEVLHESPHRSAYVLSEIHRVRGRPEEAWFRVGSSSETVVRLIGKAFPPTTEVVVGPAKFQVTGIEVQEPVVRPGEFVTLSPILLTDTETGQSLVHDSNGYSEILQAAMNAQIEGSTKTAGNIRLIRLVPQAVRKRTIKDRMFLTQKARLLMDGPEEQLRFLVNHGVGRSPALGFGMIVPNRSKPGPGSVPAHTGEI
jgi:CRISPR-associated endoribonuclease Cas6